MFQILLVAYEMDLYKSKVQYHLLGQNLLLCLYLRSIFHPYYTGRL